MGNQRLSEVEKKTAAGRAHALRPRNPQGPAAATPSGQQGYVVTPALSPLSSLPPLSPAGILSLQRTIGNAAVNQLLRQYAARPAVSSPQVGPVGEVAREVALPALPAATAKRNGPVSAPPGAEHNGAVTPGSAAQRRAEARDATAMPALAPASIQRRVFVGTDPYTEYKDDERNNKISAMARDPKIRRFKDDAEVKAFAAGNLDNMGYLEQARQWVRLDDPFIVLGENHGASTTVLTLASALKTKRFRHEAFTHFSQSRLDSDPDMARKVRESAAKTAKANDLSVTDARAHEAEHILPKVTRALADLPPVIEAQRTGTAIRKDYGRPHGGETVPARAFWPQGYGVVKAVNRLFWVALIYTRSYQGKWRGHLLKAVYQRHGPNIDQAIKALEQADSEDRIPNYQGLALITDGQGLQDMTLAFEQAAKEKIGLNDADRIAAWKRKLQTEREPEVSYTGRAQELDYLRDYSLYQFIKKSKQANDLLFGLGDAHRHKLSPVLRGDDIKVASLDKFLAEEKDKDEVAAQGFDEATAGLYLQFRGKDVRELADANGVAGKTTVTLQRPGLAGVEWKLEGINATVPQPSGRDYPKTVVAEATSADVDGSVQARLIARRNDRESVIRTITFKVEKRPRNNQPAAAPASVTTLDRPDPPRPSAGRFPVDPAALAAERRLTHPDVLAQYVRENPPATIIADLQDGYDRSILNAGTRRIALTASPHEEIATGDRAEWDERMTAVLLSITRRYGLHGRRLMAHLEAVARGGYQRAGQSGPAPERAMAGPAAGRGDDAGRW